MAVALELEAPAEQDLLVGWIQGKLQPGWLVARGEQLAAEDIKGSKWQRLARVSGDPRGDQGQLKWRGIKPGE
jgi:hypothetical protein